MRGMLAEYLVVMALEVRETIRQEWSAWDLTTLTGMKLEVKSAAYLQNWHQVKSSTIRFGIQPTRGWSAETGEYDSTIRRQADYYIFCLFSPQKRATANPLQVEQWTFYILAAKILNDACPNQKTIGLKRLGELGATKCTWAELHHWYREAYRDTAGGSLKTAPPSTL